jgi:ankyrin repeat protein
MLPKWILIPILIMLVTIAVLAIHGGERYSNYYLSPLASFPRSINGLKRTWFFCESCLKGGKCEAEDVKQCNDVTLQDRVNALDVAVGNANIEAVHFLIDVARTNVNGVTGDSLRTPLMSAAYYGSKKHQEIAEFLLLNGADVNSVRNVSPIDTALLVAIWKNNLNFSVFLLKNGANPSLTAEGLKENAACKVAIAYKRSEIISIIPGCCSLITYEPDRMQGVLNKCP